MSDSLQLSIPDLHDDREALEFFAIERAALERDAYDPFNEQALLDLAAGRRTPLVAKAEAGAEPTAVGAAIVGNGEVDLVVAPDRRREGYGSALAAEVLAGETGALTAWAHGDHPAARVLAARYGFERTRSLLRLRRKSLETLTDEPPTSGNPGSSLAQGLTIDRFDPERDGEAWVQLNALIFATHPEQGGLTIEDLRARQAESWFSAGDFLVVRNALGHLVGYNWLKIEPHSPEGEIYVLGVDPEYAGKGIGRDLMQAGLRRLRDRGCTEATLYVEATNTAAVRLYRSLDFADESIDVQYSRGPLPR